MFYDRDNSIFFRDFGEWASKEGNDFKVIFDDIYQGSNPFSSNMTVNNKELFCSVQNTDIKNLNLKAKDIIYIDDTGYVIKNIRFDRNGISELQLQYSEEEED